MKDWKSTASGILAALIGIFTAIMTYQVPTALLNPQQTKMWLYIVAGCNLASMIARAVVGVITTNADAGAVAAALNPVASHPALSIPAIPPPPTAASLAATPKTTP